MLRSYADYGYYKHGFATTSGVTPVTRTMSLKPLLTDLQIKLATKKL